jgi:hypothetical protein
MELDDSAGRGSGVRLLLVGRAELSAFEQRLRAASDLLPALPAGLLPIFSGSSSACAKL